jgi:hypothetical protein
MVTGTRNSTKITGTPDPVYHAVWYNTNLIQKLKPEFATGFKIISYMTHFLDITAINQDQQVLVYGYEYPILQCKAYPESSIQ